MHEKLLEASLYRETKEVLEKLGKKGCWRPSTQRAEDFRVLILEWWEVPKNCDVKGEQSENDPEDYLQPMSESSASGLQSTFEVGSKKSYGKGVAFPDEGRHHTFSRRKAPY